MDIEVENQAEDYHKLEDSASERNETLDELLEKAKAILKENRRNESNPFSI